MKEIWKYELDKYLISNGMITDSPVIGMPEDFETLTVQMQGGSPCLWVIVDPHKPLRAIPFCIFGTGQEMKKEVKKYVGTWQTNGFVFHLFEA